MDNKRESPRQGGPAGNKGNSLIQRRSRRKKERRDSEIKLAQRVLSRCVDSAERQVAATLRT